MTVRREEPVEARLKVLFLRSDTVPKRVCGHKGDETSFVEKAGVKRSTFRDQLGKGQLSLATQQRLATAFGFDVDWSEWAVGSADEFRGRYLKQHSDAPSIPRSVAVRLARGPRQEPVVGEIVGLARVEIDGSQFGEGSAALELLISCGTPMVLGGYISIRCGRIELKAAPAVMTRESLRSWVDSDREVRGTRGLVRMSFDAGTRSAPSWRLSAEQSSSIGTIELDPSFAAIEELAPGDTIEVTFGTWLADIENVDDAVGAEDGLAFVNSAGAELTMPHADLSIRKRRVIECLRKGILGASRGGYVVVAAHVLQVVEAPK